MTGAPITDPDALARVLLRCSLVIAGDWGGENGGKIKEWESGGGESVRPVSVTCIG